MILASTRDPQARASLAEAVLRGMPPDRGLYVPVGLSSLPPDFFNALRGLAFPDLALRLAAELIGADIPASELERIVRGAFDFPVPLRPLADNLAVLELFHGPTLAFKDFGARFLARLMAFFNPAGSGRLTVLVATSGDTGSAVAQGFFRVPGIRVVVLYPAGRITPVQERQIATLGENVTALSVAGSFDACQALVKEALADASLARQCRLTTANSINIGRLLPQIFYYVHAWAQLPADVGRKTVAVVPSGNFGNLTAGVLAQRLGVPIDHFVAATNRNDTVPRYLQTGRYLPGPVQVSIANAMDVADPSNFARLRALYADHAAMASDISGFVCGDDDLRAAIRNEHARSGTILDPHSAAGYLAARDFLARHGAEWRAFFLATAHPVKFAASVEPEIGAAVAIPERLREWLQRPLLARPLAADYSALRAMLLS
jgi:threonine synthase